MIQSGERVIDNTTGFGVVTDRRIQFYARKGWFNGGSIEDIPLRHITSVRLEIARPVVFGSLCVLCGLLFLIIAAEAGAAVLIIATVCFIALGVLQMWGWPKVEINTAGNDHRVASGLPWTKAEAQQFVQAVQNQLFGP